MTTTTAHRRGERVAPAIGAHVASPPGRSETSRDEVRRTATAKFATR
jgi:hypothetical protein